LGTGGGIGLLYGFPSVQIDTNRGSQSKILYYAVGFKCVISDFTRLRNRLTHWEITTDWRRSA
jgi:hypothetical protein